MKLTTLNGAHKKLGAKMVSFAGFEMPLWYKSATKEHMAVREKVGLFDVSHMGEVFVKGPEAEKFLNHITCNDVAKLQPGRIHYNVLMTPKGSFVDDLLIYKRADNDYLVVVNASNKDKDYACMLEQSGRFDVALDDLTDLYTQIAVQGPKAQELLQGLTDADLSTIKYYRFVEAKVLGIDAIVSRTGYTGEDGFEIYFKGGVAEAEKIWFTLLEKGEPLGVTPCGLAARDSLRLEAKMPLYGNDIGDTTTVLEADLGWIVKLDKGDFVGRSVLEQQHREGVGKLLVGFEMVDEAIPRPHGDIFLKLEDQESVSFATSAGYMPFIKRNIGMAYLPIAASAVGTEIWVEIHKEKKRAKVVPTPFYSRKK